MIKRTERGRAGHFICAKDCLFRRNTLLEKGRRRIVVSTVGALQPQNGYLDVLGSGGRYYETMAFRAKKNDAYWDADYGKQLSFKSEWAIRAKSMDDLPKDVDNRADQMHEAVVNEFIKKLRAK